MKAFKKSITAALLAASIFLPCVSVKASAAEIETTATGYTKASDVEYVKSGSYIANWGARGEDCVFLSKYAEEFYTGSYVYETMSQEKGGSSKSNAPKSDLYTALGDMMRAEHEKQTNYQETRPMYCYTDCVSSNYSKISSFYSGNVLSGTWDSGSTWNREHTWPNSKGLGGNDENDIMMLRPTSVKENSSRGNKSYGESSGYYDPGESVRGDCARIVLYVYTRWQNTSYMWGTSGVIESVDVLLRWMEEDPVDTWEMGRNDAVQAITGTRNVFVDYPEYAWLLFGEDIPNDMATPSGMASLVPDSSDKNSAEDGGNGSSSTGDDQLNSSMGGSDSDSDGETCAHDYSEWFVTKEPTETENGERRRICKTCRHLEKETLVLGDKETCSHAYGEWFVTKEATATEDGERRRICSLCRNLEKETIPAGTAASTGCAASVGASMGGVTLLLAAYAVIRRNRK